MARPRKYGELLKPKQFRLPPELIARLKRTAGKRYVSEVVREAIEEKIAREEKAQQSA